MMHDIRVSLFLAVRSIVRSNKGTLAVTLIIMSLSIMNLVFVPSLIMSMDQKSESQIVDNVLGHVVIEPEEGRPIEDARTLMRQVSRFPEVAGASVHYSMGGTISYKDRSRNMEFLFIEPTDEEAVTGVWKSIVEGKYLSRQNPGEIMLGNEISGTHDPLFGSASLGGAAAGDYVDVRFDSGASGRFRIGGIFKTDFVLADSRAMLNTNAMEALGLDARASKIIVRLRDDGLEEGFLRKLTALGVSEDIYNSRDRIGLELSGTFEIILGMLTVISLTVSMTTLFIVIYINAVNKRKLIATIKAIGVSNRIISLSFVFQSLFYAASGAVIGTLLVLAVLLPYFQRHPFDMPFGQVSVHVSAQVIAWNVASFCILSAATGYLATRQVVRRNIIETMRN